MRTVLIVLIGLALSCCTNHIYLTVDTQPPAAEIWAYGKYYGRAPVSMMWPVTPENHARGFMVTENIMAKWLSGATNSSTVKIPMVPNVEHPFWLYRDNSPGHEKDAIFGEQIVGRRNAERIADKQA